VHHFPGGTKQQYEASIGRYIRTRAEIFPTGRSSTPPARLRAAGRSWRFTNPTKAGSGSVTGGGQSAETCHATNTAHGTNAPAITNDTLLRVANQPISYPNTAVNPAASANKVT
jgi:hypothetical protein